MRKQQVLCIHGKMKKKRNKIFAKFRGMNYGVLVCTDVMARGVDIPDVHWVIQYDPPSSARCVVNCSQYTDVHWVIQDDLSSSAKCVQLVVNIQTFTGLSRMICPVLLSVFNL